MSTARRAACQAHPDHRDRPGGETQRREEAAPRAGSRMSQADARGVSPLYIVPVLGRRLIQIIAGKNTINHPAVMTRVDRSPAVFGDRMPLFAEREQASRAG